MIHLGPGALATYIESANNVRVEKMSTFNKCFGRVMLATSGVLFCAPAFAVTGTSDDLYSETIYIQKSAAEVPGSLESSARSSIADANETLAGDSLSGIESISELEPSAVPAKKVSQRRGSKKSFNN